MWLGKSAKNPGNIQKMTSETDVFSVTGGMWTMTQQTSHQLSGRSKYARHL